MAVKSLYNRKKPNPPNISTTDAHKHTQSMSNVQYALNINHVVFHNMDI